MKIFHHDRVGTEGEQQDQAVEQAEENLPDPGDVPESAIWQPPIGSLEDRI
jgi:hypothetical protein